MSGHSKPPRAGFFSRPAPMPDVAAHRDFYARGGYCEGYDEGGAVDSIGEPEDPLAFAGGGSVDDDMLAYDSQYYAGGGEVKGGLRALRNWIGTLKDVPRQPLAVGIPSEDIVDQIAKDGRFKSQFETGRSRGMYLPELRREYEKLTFGTPEDLPVEQRPIYGHLWNPAMRHVNDSARTYGDWTAILKPEVKDRATYTMGDSLGLDPIVGRGPYKFDEPIRNQYDNGLQKYLRDMTSYGSPPRHPSFPGWAHEPSFPGYVETQVHGGLPWTDVGAMVNKNPHLYPDANFSDDNLVKRIQRMSDEHGLASFAREGGNGPWWKAEPGEYSPRQIGKDLPLSELGYAEGGNVDAGEDDHGKGRFTYSPEAQRKYREQTAFENALAYALRDMPDPKSVPYMRGVGSVSVASPFDRTEPASHDYASGGSVDDDFDTEYMSQYFEEGGSVPPWMKAR